MKTYDKIQVTLDLVMTFYVQTKIMIQERKKMIGWISIKNFRSVKDILRGMNVQATDLENILVKHIFNERLSPEIQETLKNSVIRKQQQQKQFKNGQMM